MKWRIRYQNINPRLIGSQSQAEEVELNNNKNDDNNDKNDNKDDNNKTILEKIDMAIFSDLNLK